MFVGILTTVTVITTVFFPSLGVSVTEALDLWSSSVEPDSGLESESLTEAQYIDYSGYSDFAPQHGGPMPHLSPFVSTPLIDGSPLPASSPSVVESFTSTQHEFIEDIEEMLQGQAPQVPQATAPLNVRRMPIPSITVGSAANYDFSHAGASEFFDAGFTTLSRR